MTPATQSTEKAAYLTDNVQLNAEYQGQLDNLQSGIDKKVNDALKQQTGLAPDAVSIRDRNYSVVLHLLEGGKRSETTITGSSPDSIEKAVEAALAGGKPDYDPTNVYAAMDQTAEAPYFTIPVVSRSLSPTGLARHQEIAVRELDATYGHRLRQQPDSVDFSVFHVRQNYGSDGALPKGDISGNDVLVKGQSQISIGDASAKAVTRSKKVRSTVYEQDARFLVYGLAEQFLGVQEGVSRPLVTTTDGGPTVVTNSETGAGRKYREHREEEQAPRRAGGRSGSPAGLEPVGLESTLGFM